MRIASELLYLSKNIRDNAAHNRPIIFDISAILRENNRNPRSPMILKNYILGKGIEASKFNNSFSNFKLIDICCLLYLHDEYVLSKGVRRTRKKEIRKIFKRIRKSKNTYFISGNTSFDDILYTFGKIIKNYNC